MEDETDNLPDGGGTESVEPSQYDNPEDPPEVDPEWGTDDEQEVEGTDDEAAETEPEDETIEDAEEANPDDDEPEQTPITATADAVVQLADGETATVKDLIAGNMRQSDYSRKTQELSKSRSELQANIERFERINDTFTEHLAKMIPDEPDTTLALSDPNKYTAQKAQYDAAIAQVQKLIEIGTAPKEIQDGFSEADRQQMVQEENERLVAMFPEAGTREGREKFFEGAASAATEFGFSPEELQQVTDHRMFALAHWARRGLDAEKAKAKAKAKVQKAPPTSPRKPGGQPDGRKQRDAIRALQADDSIENAIAALNL